MRDHSAPLGMDALTHWWLQNHISASGSDLAHIGEGEQGGLIIDSCGTSLAQAALVCRNNLPFRRGPVVTSLCREGPVVPGAQEGLAREARVLVPMGLAPETANLFKIFF